MKKIKLFLGGYVNFTNAQNLNCASIATHIDNDKFEVFALTTSFGKKERYNFSTFKCFTPFSISKHIGFLWGIFRADIIYLPKHIDTPFWVNYLSSFLSKKQFTTIEGNVSNKQIPNLISLFGSLRKTKKYFSFFDRVYCISDHLLHTTSSTLNVQKKVLSLGVDTCLFSPIIKKCIESVIFVGGLNKRKNLDEFLNLATYFPKIKFKIVGDGPERKILEKRSPLNVRFHGMISHNELNIIFKKSDILFLPSRSEGFPKVILEAAAAGIPSIVYDSYGAENFINHNINGFIINKFNKSVEIINYLLDNPNDFKKVSEASIELANRFDWKIVIKDWENVINELNEK